MSDPLRRPPDDLDQLFALARGQPRGAQPGEYAFETRLLARLRERQPAADAAAVWARVTWRMVPFFAAAVVALTLWQATLASDASDAAALTSDTNPAAAAFSGDSD